MWKCKYCPNDVTHINVYDDHYFCNICGKTPSDKEGYFSEGKWWCISCWNTYVQYKVLECGQANTNTEYKSSAICPYCGKEVQDSWELKDGEYQCGRCNNTFEVTIIVTQEYSTKKLNKGI